MKYLIVHTHFYQPPRENPWTNKIEIQPSAAPFHDWNERIFQECYKPNTDAVIVDDQDRVVRRINNYEYYSFNFGPTLLGWIRQIHPKTYGKIIAADRKSTEAHHGHGNAIAMCYNHLIMPLANERDKITQVKWGVADFKFHFGRDPESIWLPETACNDDTLGVLIDEGIRYVILDPSQAEKSRKIGTRNWKDVTSGDINPEIPYRYFQKKSKKYIDIFFYNGPLSRNIAFDDHIYDSQRLLDRIEHVPVSDEIAGALISAAVDGETFGHHKHYTERTMSYFFDELVPRSNFRITNFGEYLSKHSPEHEVKIKPGNNNEGTSWSCAHGVGRWKEDCGCGRSEEYPSQQWRKPLRESLDWLRDELIEIFENEGERYFKNIWDARNSYISIVLDDSKENAEKFFYFNAKKFLDINETGRCLKLLEMQKFSMFMFTSCGWFFSDIAGIEAMQILQYAARAMELAKDITGSDLEAEFMNRIEHALSNSKDFRTGRDVYLHVARRPPP